MFPPVFLLLQNHWKSACGPNSSRSNLSPTPAEEILTPQKWELIQICNGQLSNARRREGERGGAATPVLGQEPKSTAARLDTGVISPASGMRVIIHMGGKKKSLRSSWRTCCRQSSVKKPATPPPPRCISLARRWRRATLALCEGERRSAVHLTLGDTAIWRTRTRSRSLARSAGVGVSGRGGAISL